MLKDVFYILRFYWMKSTNVNFELFYKDYLNSPSNVFKFLKRDFTKTELYFLKIIQTSQDGEISLELKKTIETTILN